jgi:hypothetical protein
MHDMHNMMVGMFWGGVVMAIPPVALGVWIAVWLIRQQRSQRSAERAESHAD